MDWSNDKILEFLELFEMEPCLWNLRHKSNKNRSAKKDAWQRIIDTLSYEVTLDELKKKKESLMGYYRIHLNKYKKSLREGNEIYKTSWFAFDVMDSFLRPLYKVDSANVRSPLENTEETVYIPETTIENSTGFTSDNSDNECEPSTTNPLKIKHKRHFESPEKQSYEAYKLDEYDHFGHVIASKIRKLDNIDDRETLMNSIQNLAFDFYVKSRQRSVSHNINEIRPKIEVEEERDN